MVHLAINCVKKTKTIQVFFEKIAVSGDFHSSLYYDSNHPKENEFLFSKETVVLRQWERSKQNLVLSNELIKVELPP